MKDRPLVQLLLLKSNWPRRIGKLMGESHAGRRIANAANNRIERPAFSLKAVPPEDLLVVREILRLSGKDRELLEMYCAKQMSFQEIAASTALPFSQVASRLFKIAKRLASARKTLKFY